MLQLKRNIVILIVFLFTFGTLTYQVPVKVTQQEHTSPTHDPFDEDIDAAIAAELGRRHVGGDSLDVEDLAREKRSKNCQDVPPGVVEQCIPCAGEPLQYERTDEDGNSCICESCLQPMYMNGSCKCTPGLTYGNITCILPEKRKTYMPTHNRCTQPFPCTTTCPGNMVITEECQVQKDSVCGCSDGFFQTGKTSCEPLPLCQENYGISLDQNPDSKYTSYKCVRCPDGFIQPQNNTSDKCYTRPNPDDVITGKTTNPAADVITQKPTSEGIPVQYHLTPAMGSSQPTAIPSHSRPISSSSPPSITPTYPDQHKDRRLLPRGTLSAVWILSLLVVFVLGLYFPGIKEQFTKWWGKCHYRQRGNHPGVHYQLGNES